MVMSISVNKGTQNMQQFHTFVSKFKMFVNILTGGVGAPCKKKTIFQAPH